MADSTIASRIAIRRRYVRSVDLARDAGDPDALDSYVVTPSVRDAAVRLVAGLSSQSRQRAFRVVGPYGAGKSAFGVFVAQLFRERGVGPASKLFAEAAGRSASAEAWTPVILTGRRVSFARELLRAVAGGAAGEADATAAALVAGAQSLIERPGPLDAHAVAELVSAIAAARRARSGSGLLLLIDEMGRFVEYAATSIESEDPSIFPVARGTDRAAGQAPTWPSWASCIIGSRTTSAGWAGGSRPNGRARPSATKSSPWARPRSSRSSCWPAPSRPRGGAGRPSDAARSESTERRWTAACSPPPATTSSASLPICTRCIRPRWQPSPSPSAASARTSGRCSGSCSRWSRPA